LFLANSVNSVQKRLRKLVVRSTLKHCDRAKKLTSTGKYTCVQIKKGAIHFSQYFSQMCTDLHAFLYVTLQMNSDHTGKFTTLRVTYTMT